MSIRSLVAALFALAFSAPAFAEGGSPWLPAPGATNVEFEYYRQRATQLFVGDRLADLPGPLTQDAYFFSAEHGVTDKFAIDGRIGYSKTRFAPFISSLGDSGESGLNDVHFGFRYNVADEALGAPATVSLRAAGILAGVYRPGVIDALGDSAAGAEFGFLAGKIIGGRLSVGLNALARIRVNHVPPQFDLSTYAGYSLTNRVSVFGALQFVNAFSKLQISSPGFSAARFPELEEDSAAWTVGGSVRTYKSVSLNGSVGRKFAGANTSKGGFFRLSLSYSF